MPSSFFGLNVAYTGLNAAQASINTTANNISNVQTKGYSKQTVNLSAAASLRAYQRFGSTGTGVSVDSVTQVRDEYYDTKFWNNQAGLGLYEKKLYYMEQIQNYYTDGSLSATSNAGFTTIFSKMFNALDNLKTKAGDSASRNEFISDAQELCTYFNSTAQRMQDLQSSINDEIKTTVDNINAISQKIALLNKQINIIEMEKGYANELRDQRAVLIDELSKIAPVEISERKVVNTNYEDQYTGATYFTLKINGQLLVDNYDYNTLACKPREEKYNQSDIDGLYDIVWGATGATFDATATNMSGELKAMFEVRDGNNDENLQGQITDVTATSFTVTKANITDVDFMNMPSRGTIWCNNTEYTYTSFTCETDADGNITSYTFQLDKPIGVDEQSKLRGRPMVVGDCVNYMGIPYYMNQMNTFLRSFAQAFNEIQQSGVDADGNPMGSFFVAQYATSNDEYTMTDDITGQTTLSSGANFYYQLTATNVAVAKKTQKDPDIFATQTKAEDGTDAHDLIDALAKLQSKTELFRGGGADTFLQCIYADITVDTQECEIFTDNYTNISNTIDNQRTSVSGVDEDEEAMDLIKFQNAYNLAAKCISVLTEMYDQLILNTGV
ncbi:MAG: flagellar hook-associated protein FlgK [Lachnospiraceae bacterium]|nr:flagellar hook-associated protein FlgK [Lachnospiraceae bacterium]